MPDDGMSQPRAYNPATEDVMVVVYYNQPASAVGTSIHDASVFVSDEKGQARVQKVRTCYPVS